MQLLTTSTHLCLMMQADCYRQQRGVEGVIVLDVDPGHLEMRGLTRDQWGQILLGDVIVEIDGQTVRNEDDFAGVLEQHSAGDTVKIKTIRDSQNQDYEIQLLAYHSS
jgi:S1-C subfamily serine protease